MTGMFFKGLMGSSVTLFTMVVLSFSEARAGEKVRYVFLNAVPGKTYRVGRPSSITRKFFDEVVNKIDAPENKRLRLGVSVLFDFLASPLDSVEKSLDRLLALSRETGIPVLINLDGINWMGARPDLWNWWDPSKPGFDPRNRANVEWSGWSDSLALKISWRNWGRQLRVLPAPNLSSPAVIGSQIAGLTRLVPRIVRWYAGLPKAQKYLLGGVKLGHEVSIGVNAYYYKEGNRYLEQMPDKGGLDPLESFNPEAGLSGGVTQIGYAALKTGGIKEGGTITPGDIEKVVHRFLDTLCRTASVLGLPRELLYTHQGGTFAPWEKHLSFAAGSNAFSYPGWSLYSTDPAKAGDLAKVLESRRVPGWAAVEWWWPGSNKAEWLDHLQSTLSFSDCRFIAIFNWENGLEKYPDGMAALKELITNWK